MTNSIIPAVTRCCAPVTDPGSWRSRQCSKRATLMHEDKPYCGTHDPERLNALRVARLTEVNAKVSAVIRNNLIRQASDKIVALAIKWSAHADAAYGNDWQHEWELMHDTLNDLEIAVKELNAL